MLVEVLIKNKTYSGEYETKCRERIPWEKWEEVPVPRKGEDHRKGTYVVWDGHFAERKETSYLDGVLIQIKAYVGLRDFFLGNRILHINSRCPISKQDGVLGTHPNIR